LVQFIQLKQNPILEKILNQFLNAFPNINCNITQQYTFCLQSLKKTSIHRLRGLLSPLKLNDTYRCRTAPLTSKRCILYIYSTNIDTEYFKHGI